MKEVSRNDFVCFVNENQMKHVGHSAPMPEHGYDDDVEHYEGNGCKAEVRTIWNPYPNMRFFIQKVDASQATDPTTNGSSK